MDFSNVKNITIPNGVVVKITSDGIILWEKSDVIIPDLPIPNSNEIYYTSTNGNIVQPQLNYDDNDVYYNYTLFNKYENNIGKITFGVDFNGGCEYIFSETNLVSIRLPDVTKNLGFSAFSSCENLVSVILPQKLNNINISCFSSCVSLRTITIPNLVTFINSRAFSNCVSLHTITIGNSVNQIGDYVFMNCRSLNHITSLNPISPTLRDKVFQLLPEGGILRVPEGSDYSTWLEQLPDGWKINYITE